MSDAIKRAKLNLPADLIAGVMAGRPEAIRLTKPRDMKAAEAADLYELIALLVDQLACANRTIEHLRHHIKQAIDMAVSTRSLARNASDAARAVQALLQATVSNDVGPEVSK